MQDPSKVSFNASKCELSDCEKRFLAKGLNLSLPTKHVRNLGILSNEDLDFIKTRTKDAALFFYRNYNKNVPQHLSKKRVSYFIKSM